MIKLIIKASLFLTGLFLLVQTGMGQQKRVALISDYIEQEELNSLVALLEKQQNLVVTTVSLREVTAKQLAGYSHLWYHRTDTTRIHASEHAAKARVQQFVKNGGTLLLTMESVPLLNNWGFEDAKLNFRQDTIRDEGFGRPLGFHAFKAHPLFEGMMGGAYVSKQKADHIARKHGFFGSSVPRSGKVIGIDWTYITFTEQNKLLFEYSYGKGTVLAAGAYLYYAAENRNEQQLQRFTANLINYQRRTRPAAGTYYWNFERPRFTETNFRHAKLTLQPAEKWNLPLPSLSIPVDTPGTDFYDLVGRRMLWMGKLNGGLDEIWIHPFMAIRDFEVGVKLKSEDSVHWFRHLRPKVTVTPEYLIRNYQVGTSEIKEIYAVSYDQPLGVAHYEVKGGQVEQLVVRYASNLRYMWPYSHLATGSLQYGFDPQLNTHIISGQGGELNTLVHYSVAPVQQAMKAFPEKHQVQVDLTLPFSVPHPVNISIQGNSSNRAEALAQLRTNQQQTNRIFEATNRYYRQLLGSHLSIETPDTIFNQGYAWALARTDQFVQTTPNVGTALMAGFGTTARGWNGRHSISGRPGYAWYFGRDAQWSAMAINAYGDFAAVKEQLETFVRFQDLNGKIYHELTSSGVAHYDASDATPLFIVLAEHYLKYSGDTAYIRTIWPAILKALEFCEQTDTDRDGLIENTNVGHGWIEGGALFGTHTEFYLAGCWAAALDAMSYMGHALGLPHQQYADRAMQVKQIIDRDFWNASKGYFYNGKFQDGSYMDQSTGFATVPMYLNAITDKSKSLAVMQKITGSLFSTDWGIRMLEENNPKYKPGSYHAGMVWPLYNGWGSMGAYSNGLYKAGYQYIMNSLQVYQHWAPGSIEETLNGEIFKPNGVCSHQCWSETMVVQPAIEGMLGLSPDAVGNRVRLSPVFPWHWDRVAIKNIRVGDQKLNVLMTRKNAETTYEMESNGVLDLSFSPAFPLLTQIEELSWNEAVLPYKIRNEADGIRVDVQVPVSAGKGQLRVKTLGGIGALPVITPASLNQRSKGLKILKEKANANSLELTAEGRPGMDYQFQVYAAFPIKSIKNASIVKQEGAVLTIGLQLPEAAESYIQQTIELLF